MPKRDLSHVARTLALCRARNNGWIEGRTLQELGDRLGVHRATVMRNLRDLDEIQQLADQYLDQLAPHVKTKAPQ